DKRRFVPEDRGRLVTAFLTSFFEHYVEYNFTADLENQLDDISGGRIDWKEVLRRFWRDFSGAVEGTKDLKVKDVLGALDEALGRHVFPDPGDRGTGAKPKRVALPRNLKPGEVDRDTALRLLDLPRELGRHPDSGEPITAGIGRFGAYLKHGPAYVSLGAEDDVLTIGLNRAV